MHIIYADDDRMSLNIVNRALQARGHSVYTIYTGDAASLQTSLQSSLSQTASPAYVILDGHNLALDEQGKPIVDIQPTWLMNWLRQHGLNEQARFILYSNDDKLLQQAKNDPSSGFWLVVSKVGERGGLTALLHSLETV